MDDDFQMPKVNVGYQKLQNVGEEKNCVTKIGKSFKFETAVINPKNSFLWSQHTCVVIEITQIKRK